MKERMAVVMATFNGAQWLEEQLASIRAQTHEDWHLFVRDDGSTDATIETVRRLVPTEKLTIIDPRGRRSGSPAGNFFAALCEVDLTAFDFVAFADQDDVWSPGKLSRAIDRLRSTGTQGYSCDLIAFDNTNARAWYLAKSQAVRPFDYLFQGASAGCTYVLTQQAAQLVAAKVRSWVDNFPAQRSHDWLIYAICRSHGLQWYLDQSAHIYYRQHGANAFGAMPNAGGLLARWRLSRQRWYRSHVLWLANFLALSPNEAQVLQDVERLGIPTRLRLALRARQFRRTARDQWLLRVAFISGSF